MQHILWGVYYDTLALPYSVFFTLYPCFIWYYIIQQCMVFLKIRKCVIIWTTSTQNLIGIWTWNNTHHIASIIVLVSCSLTPFWYWGVNYCHFLTYAFFLKQLMKFSTILLFTTIHWQDSNCMSCFLMFLYAHLKIMLVICCHKFWNHKPFMSHPFFEPYVYEHDQEIIPHLKTLKIISLTLKMSFYVQLIHVMLCKVESMFSSPR
jgi:hypothetical protein